MRKEFWLLALMLLCSAVHAAPGTVTYVYTDPQGTVLMETDAQGNITARFDYTPYGAQALGTPPNGPGYTGHVNDPDTGLVYMQQRYYDPMGRMLSVDPVGPTPGDVFSFNRYGYANNNPIINIDPDGRASVGEIIDGNAQASSDAGDHLQTYGWALAGVAWSAFGAEGVSQVADKGTSAGGGNMAMAAIEVVTLGKGGPIAKEAVAAEKSVAKAVAGKITGYTRHGLNQAISRDGGRGVAAKSILAAVKNPAKVVEQAGGKVAHTGADGTRVVLNREGKVVTVIPKTAEAVRDAKIQ